MCQHGTEVIALIAFKSGVLQGCPGSGFLFNNALDPFLIHLDYNLRVKRAGIVRACADDIGISLRRLKHLAMIQPIFSKAEMLAGLVLKPSKCVIVPLCDISEEIRGSIITWLQNNIPVWDNFSIQTTTKLLGFYIGPKSASMNWSELLLIILWMWDC